LQLLLTTKRTESSLFRHKDIEVIPSVSFTSSQEEAQGTGNFRSLPQS